MSDEITFSIKVVWFRVGIKVPPFLPFFLFGGSSESQLEVNFVFFNGNTYVFITESYSTYKNE